MEFPKERCGFIGVGAMGGAMAAGVYKSKIFKQFNFSDVSDVMLKRIGELCPGSFLTKDNLKLLEKSDVVVLAVKPQFAAQVIKPLIPYFEPRHLVVSIMGGVMLKEIRALVGPKPRIVRVMPNVALQALKGATTFVPDPSATQGDASLVEKMFSSIGFAAQVTESIIDATTSVAGSSPAFVAVFIEALADGGVKEGVPRALALKLAANAVYGSAAMLVENHVSHPAVMKDMVCSPGGISIVGVAALEKEKFRHAVISAVSDATNFSRKMSKL